MVTFAFDKDPEDDTLLNAKLINRHAVALGDEFDKHRLEKEPIREREGESRVVHHEKVQCKRKNYDIFPDWNRFQPKAKHKHDRKKNE